VVALAHLRDDATVDADVEAVAADFLSRDTGDALDERRSSRSSSSQPASGSGGRTTIGSADGHTAQSPIGSLAEAFQMKTDAHSLNA
jgi:hypothetical protein